VGGVAPAHHPVTTFAVWPSERLSSAVVSINLMGARAGGALAGQDYAWKTTGCDEVSIFLAGDRCTRSMHWRRKKGLSHPCPSRMSPLPLITVEPGCHHPSHGLALRRWQHRPKRRSDGACDGAEPYIRAPLSSPFVPLADGCSAGRSSVAFLLQ
jgi:hypothetical protein